MLVDALRGSVVIDATIDATAAGDTAKLRLFNLSKKPANTITFKQDIGVTEGLEEIEINSNVAVTFEGAVVADTTTVGTTSTVTYQENVTGDINFTADGTVILSADKTITGNITTATDGIGTLEIAAPTGAHTPIVGDIGASGKSLKKLVLDVAGQAVDFDGSVFVDTVSVSGTDTVGALNLNEGMTGNLVFQDDVTVTVAADKVLAGSVTTSADGEGTLNLSAGTSNVTVATGQIGTSALKLKALNVSTAGAFIATLSGDVFADEVEISNAATGKVIFTGDVTSDLDISITGGTAQFSGDVTSGQFIDATAGDAIFKGNVTATGGIDATGFSLTFDGTTAQTVDAVITAASSLTVDNSKGSTFTETVDDVIALNVEADAIAVFEKALNNITTLTIAAGGSAEFESTYDGGSIDLDGSIRVEDTVTLSGNLNIGAGAVVTLGNGIQAGETVFNVADVTSGGASTINLPATFTTGTVVFASNGSNDGDYSTNFTVTSNALVDYVLDVSGSDIKITATAKTAAQTAADLGVSKDVATALPIAVAAVDAGGDADGAAALNSALNAGGATATKAAEQVAVQGDTLSGTTVANIATSQRVFNVTSDRLATLRFGGQYGETVYEGLSTGDYGNKGVGMWFRPFGNWLSQDANGGVAGYDATTYGIAGGADTFIDDREQYRAGLSVAVSQTDVDGDGAGKSTVEIQSAQFTAYADFTGKAYFADLMAGYAYNGNDTSRIINFGGLDRTVTGSYTTHQFMVAGNAGLPMHLRGTAYFTPIVGFNYTYVMGADYTEKGGGGFSQKVDQDDLNVLVAKLDTRLHSKIRLESAYLVPSITAGVSYDVIGDNASATAQYTGGGAAFKVDGADVEQFGGHAGFGLGYELDGIRIGFDYDAEFKSGSIGHSARFEARIDF